MTVLNLIIILTTIILPIMASDAPLQKRIVPWRTLTLSTPTVTTTSGAGQVGSPLVLSSSPTTTAQGIRSTPLYQPAPGGQVGTATFQSASSETASPMVGTPIAISSSSSTATGGLVGSPLSQPQSSFFDQHTINSNLPNYAVLLIIILCLFAFFSIGAFFVYRFYKRRQFDLKRKDVDDEEDIMAAYSRFWKKKQRNSGGGGFISVKEKQACAVHVEDKVQRRV